MARIPSFAGQTGPLTYLVAAPLLLLVQPFSVLVIYRLCGWPLVLDSRFWILPLRRLAMVPMLTATQAAVAFAIGLIATGILALFSFRRAQWSGFGHIIAVLTLVPGVQVAASAVIALLPRHVARAVNDPTPGLEIAHIIQGVCAGVAIIVLAVLISALTFGAYGWGLFVMTPFSVGMATGYLVNRRHRLGAGRTSIIVLTAAALGTVALVMLALEGLVCILLASPLGAIVALLGGAAGRAMARTSHSGGQPLMSVAILPALFALESAMPPAVPIETHEEMEINASPEMVWGALTSSAPIANGPGLVGAAGLAYPVRGRLLGAGVGAIRLGDFSTGTARELVTEWLPNHRLAFTVLQQPPAMEEMSPYRQVRAPHVHGYFITRETRFSLVAIPGGRTRLIVDAQHVLRIDPALYWEPMARMAIHLNVARVLEDVCTKATDAAGVHNRSIARQQAPDPNL